MIPARNISPNCIDQSCAAMHMLRLLAPINYTGFVWACLIGILVWDDWPDGMTLQGAAAIIGANLWLAWCEHKQKKKQVK